MTIKKTKSKPTPTTKPTPISTLEIELALAKYYNVRTNIIVPNVSWGLSGMHECDILVVSGSGYATEIEIKISKADFLKDFEKSHGHVDRKNRIKTFYYAMPKELYIKVKDLIPENAGVIVCERHLRNYSERFPKNHSVYAKVEKTAVNIKNAKKLTDEEILKVAKLGCMRIFTLKAKILTLKNK